MHRFLADLMRIDRVQSADRHRGRPQSRGPMRRSGGGAGRRVLQATSTSLLAGIVTVAFATPSFGSAAVTRSNERFTFVGETIAGCNGETLVVEFQVHSVDVFVIGDSGTVTIRSHQDVHGTAIGSLGNEYVIAGVQANVTITSTLDGDGTLEVTVTNQLHNVSKGSADNLLVIATTHTTYDPNGNLRAEATNAETICVG